MLSPVNMLHDHDDTDIRPNVTWCFGTVLQINSMQETDLYSQAFLIAHMQKGDGGIDVVWDFCLTSL